MTRLAGGARRPWGVLILLAVAVAGFVLLGNWQVHRRQWKLDLIARVDQHLRAPPVALPDPARWPAIGRDDTYLKVRATGVLLNDRATLVQAVTVLGGGFWLVTPLRTGGVTVLVNRGFVPAERPRAASAPTEPVTVTGLLRLTEPGGGFLRANDPRANRWYSRDVAAIAAARRLAGPVAPFFIDADRRTEPGPFPAGGLTVTRFPNNHLVYALTWYGLALLCIVWAVLLWRAPGRGGA